MPLHDRLTIDGNNFSKKLSIGLSATSGWLRSSLASIFLYNSSVIFRPLVKFGTKSVSRGSSLNNGSNRVKVFSWAFWERSFSLIVVILCLTLSVGRFFYSGPPHFGRLREWEFRGQWSKTNFISRTLNNVKQAYRAVCGNSLGRSAVSGIVR